jgi:hypothetical protein
MTTLLSAGLLSAPATAAPANAAPATSEHFHLSTTLTGVSFQSEAALSNGDYTAMWKTPTGVVKVAAPSGSTVTVVASPGGSAEVGVTLPTRGTKSALPNFSPAGSIVANAMAVGYSAAQARALVMSSRIQPNWSPGDVMDTPCAYVSGDGGHAWGRACNTQVFVQDNGGGNWILGDEIVGSGNDLGFGNLSTLRAWVQYGANNTIFNWSPASTVPEGNCTSYSATVGSISASTTVCADRLDPYGANTSTKFGASWSGCDSEGYTEGMASADKDNNPTNASAWARMNIYISWDYLC